MGGEGELERIKGTREESLEREIYPSAKAAARPLHEPLRAHAFGEPVLQDTDVTINSSSGEVHYPSGYNPPMTSPTAVALVVLATTIFACRSQPRSAAQHPSESRVPSQDTAFAGTMAPVQRVRSFRPGVARPVLRHVEAGTGASPGYDRVVFEFTGDSVPGYRVEYTTKPVQRCGLGDPVAVAGKGLLSVSFEPAPEHDEHGDPTL